HAARGPPGDRRELHRRRAILRRPGRPRGAHPRAAGRDRRPRVDPPRPGHRAQDRGDADRPGPDQGDGDPRDTGRGVRQIAPAGAGRITLGNPTNGGAPRPPGACRVLMIGDIIGRPGRHAVERELPGIREERGIDFVTANGENVAGGMGLTASTATSLLEAGVDVITSGNHIWDKREIYPVLEANERILRPLNYSAGDVPGRGWGVFQALDGSDVAV